MRTCYRCGINPVFSDLKGALLCVNCLSNGPQSVRSAAARRRQNESGSDRLTRHNTSSGNALSGAFAPSAPAPPAPPAPQRRGNGSENRAGDSSRNQQSGTLSHQLGMLDDYLSQALSGPPRDNDLLTSIPPVPPPSASYGDAQRGQHRGNRGGSHPPRRPAPSLPQHATPTRSSDSAERSGSAGAGPSEINPAKRRNDSVACTWSSCNMRFRDSYNMRIHYQAVHLKEKKYKCSECGLAFAGPSGLSQHRETIHQKIIFTCGKCNKEFRSRSGLNEHKRKHRH